MKEWGEWDGEVDKEMRKDDRLMERQHRGRADGMMGADGQRAGERVTDAAVSSLCILSPKNTAECSTQTRPLLHSHSVCSCLCVHKTDAASVYGSSARLWSQTSLVFSQRIKR